MSLSSELLGIARTAKRDIGAVGNDIRKGVGFAENVGKAFVRNVTGGDIRSIAHSKGIKGYKKGGNVKRTGLAYLHKGEKVITAKKKKKVAKALRAYRGK